MANSKIRKYCHIAVLTILIIVIVLGSLLIIYDVNLFYDFITIYAILSFSFLSYRYFFGIISYPLHYVKYKDIIYEPSVSIVIPCYNEEKEILKKCITSACTIDYPKKEIIVIDDGSSNDEMWSTITELNKVHCFRTFRFEKNRGKRCAMALGFREAKNDILITMDSDSIITSGDSVRELVKPLVDRSVGTVSGCILVNNVKKSLMTRMQDARYWMAFYIEKSSQDPYNSVTCASGPFSAYRKEYLMKYLDMWENQIFLDNICTYGDDRGLSTFMLKNGYDIKFSRDAILYTDVPETLTKFVKQQTRWKKSFIRESWYLSKFIYKRNIFMNIEFLLFWTVFLLGFVAKFTIILLLIFGSVKLASYITALLFMTFLHNTYMFVKSPGKRGYFGVMYGFFNEFMFSWIFFYSFATLRDGKWGTR